MNHPLESKRHIERINHQQPRNTIHSAPSPILCSRQVITHINTCHSSVDRALRDDCNTLELERPCPGQHLDTSTQPLTHESSAVSAYTTFRDLYSFGAFTFMWWIGQSSPSSRRPSKSNTCQNPSCYQSYVVGLAMNTPWSIALRAELRIYFWRKVMEPSISMSIVHTLSFPTIVPWSTRSVHATKYGDISAMRLEFGSNQSSPFDVLADGSTYLHVCPLGDFVKFDMSDDNV